MGIMRKVAGKAARAAANSGVVHNVATQAADALDQSGVGGRAGRIASGILRDPGHRESAINIATGVFTPGVRNKFGAAKEARNIARGLRGGGGVVSPDQFGHLPPPPGAGSHSAVPDWDRIPGSGSHGAVPSWEQTPDWDRVGGTELRSPWMDDDIPNF